MKFWNMVVGLFALIGLGFVLVFISMQFGWLNVRGTIRERNESILSASPVLPTSGLSRAVVLCQIHALADYAPETAESILVTYESKNDGNLADRMIQSAAVQFSQTLLPGILRSCQQAVVPGASPEHQSAYSWANSDEWGVLSAAFIRDADVIRRAARDAGISPRLLLGGVIGEQFRFFTSSRDSFKAYFEPLKILASLSKFSYGIAGLKPETARRIEENLHNPESPFYLGPEMEQVITYPEGADQTAIRFERITDTKDPYYSYLYVGLFMRQVMAQWQRAGYDISNRPEVLATLYNLGFPRSIPKSNPSAGGAIITVNNNTYTFGDLAREFYYSGELVQEFPF